MKKKSSMQKLKIEGKEGVYSSYFCFRMTFLMNFFTDFFASVLYLI